MVNGKMKFLNEVGFTGRRPDAQVTMGGHSSTGFSRQTHANQPSRLGSFHGRTDVTRVAGSAEADQQVAAVAKPPNKLREDEMRINIVGKGRAQ